MSFRVAVRAVAQERGDLRLARRALPLRPSLRGTAWASSRATIRLVVSNHPELGEVAAHFGVPFHHVPVTAGERARRRRRRSRCSRRTRSTWWSSPGTCRSSRPSSSARYPSRIINIHHSFLPAFVGAAALPPGPRAWREAHRGDGPLRHRGARRGADHRPGRRAHLPSRRGRATSFARAAISRRSSSRAPCACTSKTESSSTGTRPSSSIERCRRRCGRTTGRRAADAEGSSLDDARSSAFSKARALASAFVPGRRGDAHRTTLLLKCKECERREKTASHRPPSLRPSC